AQPAAAQPAANPPAQPAQPAKGIDAPGKGKRAQEFIAAFNRGDAKAVAAFWTPDGDYTDHTGKKIAGRAALEKLYAKGFGEHKGSKLAVTVTSHRMIAPDVALEEGISEVMPAVGNLPSVSAFSAVLVKKDGEWYFESVREGIAQPPTNADHFADIEWLLGEW